MPLALDRSAITSSAARSQKIRAKAYKRIVSGHLYEHRCMRLIESIFNCSLDTTPWLAEARIQSIRNTLTQSLPRCKQVICSGFYGASNLGDELILRSIATALQASDAAVQVVVAAENPVAVEREHGLPAFHGKNLNEALHHVRTASAIIVGGGGLWHDYSFERSGGLTGIFQEPQLSMASFATLPIMGRFFNTPCHVLGMGVGPITTPDALRMLRFVAGLADTIQVRDEASLALLTKAGVKPGKANMAPDLVYALTLPPVQPAPALVQLKTEGYTLVAINLRPWAFGDQSALFASVAQALHLLSQTAKLAIVTIPMQTSDNATLSSFVANWCAELKHVMLQAPLSQEELLSTLMVVDLVLAMRLHTCLVAHRLHKPVVGLAYDPKVANHFAQLTRTQFAIALDTQATKIFDTVNLVLKTQWTSESQQQLTSLEAEARAALAIATHRIAALPRVNEVFEEHRDVATIRGELNDLRTLQKLNIGG